LSFKEWKLSDLLSNGFHLLDEESVKRANKWVDIAFSKHGNTFDKLMITNDGDGYNKVFGLKDGMQIFLDEFGIYQEALLFAEQVIEKGNVKTKNIILTGFGE
jgi:hypothetical protein